jgi:hypothetical protein
MDNTFDYNAAFKSTSLKLKKRFLRKPNVAEAIEEYNLLSRQLESEECFGLAASCMQQVAKCYQSVGNQVSASNALQTAAKLYLNSEIMSTSVCGFLTLNEDLLSCVSCYEECIKLHCDQNERQLAAKLCLELADILTLKFEKFFESISYYERAMSLFSNPDDQSVTVQVLLVHMRLAALKVFTCDYSGALNSYTEICNAIANKYSDNSGVNSPNKSSQTIRPNNFVTNPSGSSYNTHSPLGFFSRILVDADICKMLLLIFLKPTKMKPEHSLTMEVYSSFQTITNNNTNYLTITCMDRDLFIMLQSFVMSVQSNDVDLLYSLQTDLWPILNQTQNHLVNLITDQLINSSYTDDLMSFQ